jgi:hypothetical protein
MWLFIHTSKRFEDQFWVLLQKLFLVTPKTVVQTRYNLMVLVQLPIRLAGLFPNFHLLASLKCGPQLHSITAEHMTWSFCVGSAVLYNSW